MDLKHWELKHIFVVLSRISETPTKSEEIKFWSCWELLHWSKYIVSSKLESSVFQTVDWSGNYEGCLRL